MASQPAPALQPPLHLPPLQPGLLPQYGQPAATFPGLPADHLATLAAFGAGKKRPRDPGEDGLVLVLMPPPLTLFSLTSV